MPTLIDVLKQNGVRFKETGHEHCRPGWVQVDCPRCSMGWEHYRLGINHQYGYANCWSCGRLNLAATLEELTRKPYRYVKEQLAKVSFSRRLEGQQRAGKLVWPKGTKDLGDAHKRYLTERNLDWEEAVRLWGLRATGALSSLPWRIIIPITLHGEIVSWTSRAIGESNPRRYLAASKEQEKVSNKTLLFGEDYCRHTILVCEGAFDAMRIGPGAVATCGTAFTMAQVARIARYPKRGILFDNEATAQREAEKLCDLLSPLDGETFLVHLDSGKDPSACDEDEINQLREEFLS